MDTTSKDRYFYFVLPLVHTFDRECVLIRRRCTEVKKYDNL